MTADLRSERLGEEPTIGAKRFEKIDIYSRLRHKATVILMIRLIGVVHQLDKLHNIIQLLCEI